MATRPRRTQSDECDDEASKDVRRRRSRYKMSVGLEAAAVEILKRAVDMDTGGRRLEAQTCYTEGADLLIQASQAMSDCERRKTLQQRALQYIDRAEKLQKAVAIAKAAGKFHEQLRIAVDSTGHDYDTVFRALCDDKLTAVAIDDAYVKAHHQLVNFTRFAEFLLRRAPHLESITLTTTKETGEQRQLQVRAFTELESSLRERRVALRVEYSNTLHDREIRFDNGWIAKIGRGLDYFKKAPSNYAVGAWDMNLRKCHETTIDIFHTSTLRNSK